MSGEGEVTATPVDTSPNTGSVEVVDVNPQAAEAESQEASQSETPPQEEAPKKERISPKLSKIAEREAKAAEREAEAERKLAEAQEARRVAEEKAAKLELLKKTPTKVLKELGLSLNDIAKAVLEEGDSPEETEEVETEESKLNKRIEALEKEREDEKERAKQAADAAEQAKLDAAIAGIKVKINEHIEANADQYDLIRASGNQELVFAIMEESFRDSMEKNPENPEVIFYKDACDLAEKYLLKEFEPLTKSKKIVELVSPKTQKKALTSFGRTLSSQAATQAPAATDVKVDVSKMSHDERVKHAAKLLRFN